MNKIIKAAVEQSGIDINNSALHGGVTCSMMSLFNEDILLDYKGKDKYVFDLVTIAKLIKTRFELESTENLSCITPLGYAELYSTVFGGNTIVFLKNYQNYIAPIE